MVDTLMDLFQSEDAPDPRDVAKAIARLVEQPSGQRPARVVVGQPFGAETLNTHADSVQKDLLAGLRLEFLGTPRTADATLTR